MDGLRLLFGEQELHDSLQSLDFTPTPIRSPTPDHSNIADDSDAVLKETDIGRESREIPYQYEYAPLYGEGFVRILRLEAGKYSDDLVGSLQVGNLIDAPKYEAHSYTWGKPLRCQKMILDGKVLPLTQSLNDALRTIRSNDRPLVLWVDQICIDQRNSPERTHQVKLMNSIFKGTEKVLVFLGNDDEKMAKKAFDLVHDLFNIMSSNNKTPFDVKRSRVKAVPLHEWANFKALCKLPWFNRMWIRQEIGTAAPAELFWGDASFSWELLHQVCKFLVTDYKLLHLRHNLKVSKITYLYRNFVESGEKMKKRRNFVSQLHFARICETTDPRDHVFAMLGHFMAPKDPSGLPLLEADYDKDKFEVFHETAICLLKNSTNLEIFNAVQHTSDDFRGKLCSLLPFREFYERKRIRRRDFALDSSTPLNHKLIQDMWTTTCGHSTFNLSQKYINGETAVFAFLQSLAAGFFYRQKFAASSLSWDDGSRAAYHEIPKSIWLAHGAAFLKEAFKNTGLLEENIVIIADDGDAEAWLTSSVRAARGRRFFRTSEGYYGIGPPLMKEGDVVAVLLGGTTPFVLRPVDGEEHFLLLGECYVHGIMFGEALDMVEDGKRELKDFYIH